MARRISDSRWNASRSPWCLERLAASAERLPATFSNGTKRGLRRDAPVAKRLGMRFQHAVPKDRPRRGLHFVQTENDAGPAPGRLREESLEAEELPIHQAGLPAPTRDVEEANQGSAGRKRGFDGVRDLLERLPSPSPRVRGRSVAFGPGDFRRRNRRPRERPECVRDPARSPTTTQWSEPESPALQKTESIGDFLLGFPEAGDVGMEGNPTPRDSQIDRWIRGYRQSPASHRQTT